METSNFGPELHVAQQSRREKLRFLSHSDNPFSGHDPGNNLNPDLVQFRNLRYGNLSYEPVAFPPEVINFADTNSSQPLMFHQESANKVSGGDPQNCSTWKSIGSQETCDWIIDSSPNPVFVGSSSLKSNSNYNNNYNFAPHEMAASWRNVGNELVLLPAFADQSPPLRCDNPCDGSNNNPQALSLSLSSIPLQDFTNLNQEMKAMKSEYLCSDVKTSSYNGKGVETDQHGMVSSNNRSLGPLGPFTGYATILKSSRFLRPAQQLLDEFCNMVGPNKFMKNLESHEKISSVIRAPCDDVNVSESIVRAVGGDSGGSSSTFFSFNNEKTPEVRGFSSSGESYRPEFLQKKAKLLYMLEEVCRRYKHYNQQMQMVVSAFETVAGLSAATPYICQALRSISRHFRCLRNAISDQLKNVRKALGEDLSSSQATGTSSSSKGGDTSMTSRLKLMDQTLQKQKAAGFFDAQPHAWRPQRGLPERAVAILRAWLFDHFLHPYPTDADKHMLATQTGLSRNQVSNWFINARVRLWKPMVEEIHMLETKGTPAETDARATNESVTVSNDHFQTPSRLNSVGFPEKQVECPEIGSGFIGGRMHLDDWNQKRSRVDCQIPETTTMDGSSLVGFVPYQQKVIDIGRSLGPVSLTLGLRRNADGLQQHQQQQNESHLHHHQQFRGDQILYDFVG